MKKAFLLIMAIVSFSFCATAQSKKVALLETLNGDKSVQVRGIEMNMVRGELRKAISNQAGYQAFTRTDIDQLMKEQKFQQSGMVSDAQRKKLGEMSGADYICVSTLTKSNVEFYLEAYLVDVETGEMSNPASQYGMLEGGTYANLFQICQDLASELTGYVGGSNTAYGNSYRGGSTTTARNQSFTETAYGLNMRMVYVEGGTFTMGCTSEQSDCYDDEKPTRRTTVSSFYIGMLEVTQSQWEKVMGTTVYQQRDKVNTAWPMFGTGYDYPMYYVSWEEAKEFCACLSRQTGKTYRLPTEAEWEYAARGGNKKEGTKYSGGWSVGEVAWYCNNSGDRNLSLNDSNWDGNIVLNNNCKTHPCGTKKANALGIYDMSGNVCEWCEDWYGSYLSYDTNNPKGASSGQNRVLRGGGWGYGARYCRVSLRDGNAPSLRGNNLGFRVVLVP